MQDHPPRGEPVATPRQAFGQALRYYRTRRGVSQERLAHESGLDRTYISMLERGRKGPSIDTIFRLAELLGVRPSELILLAETHVLPPREPIAPE